MDMDLKKARAGIPARVFGLASERKLSPVVLQKQHGDSGSRLPQIHFRR